MKTKGVISYDDERLIRLFEQLDEKARSKAIRGAFSKAASELRKVAVANYTSDTKGASKDSKRGIRAVVYKRRLGFRVTIGTRRQKLKYSKIPLGERGAIQRRRRKEIAPLWLTTGTTARFRTRRKAERAYRAASGSRKGYTGSIQPPRTFMERTRLSELPRQTDNIRNAIFTYVEKAAIKHGARLD